MNVSSPTVDTDVVIIGGGPVGSLLALLLDDHGVRNLVIERDLEPYHLPRAIVMDDEIQRLFHEHDMGPRLTAMTTPLRGADFVDAKGSRILGANVPPVGLQGLPPVVCHFQPELDRFLQREAIDRGTDFRRGRTAATLNVGTEGLITTLDDGTTVASRWLVGCDGASSWTRRTLGLPLEDLRFDQQWLVVDVELKADRGDHLPSVLQQVCDPRRPVTYVPGHARYRRWEFQIQPGEDVEDLLGERGLWSLLEGWITTDDAEIVRAAAYRFHAVVAPRMQQGPVFLAGDSAHQMPPFLGQGLNSGSRDAANLAWKLALVNAGRASDRLLETYSMERVPHVRGTVEHAADMGRLIDQLAGRESHGLDHSAGYGGQRPQPRLEAGLVVPGHTWVGRPFAHHPEVYAGLRDCGLSFVLATRSEAMVVPGVLQQLGCRKVVVDGDSIDDQYAAVIRPDGYVAAMAGDADELDRAVDVMKEFL